jgi:hypothetical protein
MADLNSPVPGLQLVPDGQPALNLRGERTGAVLVQQAHAPYAEETQRGNVWTISTPIAGVTCTTLVIVSTASAMPILGLYNPVGSAKNLVLQKVVMINQGATAITFVLGAAALPGMTSTSGGAVGVNNLNFGVGSHTARTFIGAVVIVGTPITFRYLTGASTGAVTAGTVEGTTEYTDGDVVVAPGNFLGVFTVLVGGLVQGSLTWAEVPV